MNKITRILVRALVPILIVIGGAGIMIVLAVSRQRPERQEHEVIGALVNVIEAERMDRQVIITGNGTVQPRYQVNVIPQVAGRVVWVHPDLAAGGEFDEGDTLVIIEQRDYELAVQQAEASVAQAEYGLEMEQANSGIARREWELMHNTRTGLLGESGAGSSEPDPLVLREPQMRQAEAGLASAQALLEMARLNLERTVITAPFNCKIRNQNVAVGQLVGQTSAIASLYNTDLAEIEIGLPQGDLSWMRIPGARARVKLDTGDGVYEWTGRVDRSVGVVDEIGRLERVVVQVRNPYNPPSSGHPELSVGSFVSVEIEGRTLENTFVVPRGALHENNQIWLVGEDSDLVIRDVVLHKMTPTEAIIAEGVSDGDQIVVTTLTGAANGMKLRPVLLGEEE